MKTIGMKYCDAIKNINPNWVGSVHGDTEEELVIDWNGQAEISVADIQAKISEMETAEINAENQKATDKASGKQKLIDLGLTEDEVNIIYGDN